MRTAVRCCQRVAGRARPLVACVPAALVLLAAATGRAPAQRLPNESLGEQLIHETWTKGLPGNVVHQIAQGRDGYLYLATNGGLARFDGVRFVVHRSPSVVMKDSLPDNYVNGVIEASDGAIWLATMHSGVVEFRDGRFTSFPIQQVGAENEAYFVYEDLHHTLWAGTRMGLVRRVGDHFEPVPYAQNVGVRSLGEDASGALWIGTEDGLFVVRGAHAEKVLLPPFGTSRVLGILRARDGVMWLATTEGLVQMERPASGPIRTIRLLTLRDGLHSAYLTSVAEQVDGTIWVSSLGGGITRLDRNGRLRSLRTGEGLADNNVERVFVDGDGSVWAATVDGLTRVRTPLLAMWLSPEPWTASMLWSANALSDGSVLVGTGGDGAVRIARDGSTRQYRMADGLPSDVVLTSLLRRNGSLWVGTKAGVARFAGGRFVDETEAQGLKREGVRTLFEDSRGGFWIGTDWELTVGTPQGRVMLRHGARTMRGRVYNMAEDAMHRLWVASGNLSRVSGDSLAIFVSASGDTLPSSMDVYVDSAGVWASSYTRGLTLIRGDTMHFLSNDQTGLSRQVLRILDDGAGSLWLTSDAGIQRVRKADLVAYAADSAYPVAVRSFTKFDGLRSHDFSKSGSTSGTRGPDGRLWLPTTSGLVVLDPGSIRADNRVPHVYVEAVSADGEPVPVMHDVTLPRGARRVRIEFTSPQLATPSRVRLWYKLDGIDRDWRLADPLERLAVYDDLPRGEFSFLVQSENPDGVRSATAEVRIVSRPALTRSGRFWALILVLVAVAAAIVYRWRIGKLHEHSAFLQRVIDERTESLAERERLEHQLLHTQKLESVGRLAGGVAHDLNNLLTAILGHTELALSEPDVPEHLRADLGEVRTVTVRAANLTRQLLAFARKQVVQPRVLNVGALVRELDTLVRRLLAENIAYFAEADEGDWAVRADPSQVEQVILNLALNARDAMPGGGRLTIRTSAMSIDRAFIALHPEFAPGDYVLLEVADTGVGMSPEVQSHLFEPFFTTKEPGKGTGLGLATAFGIVTQSGGHILVESRSGEGSSFRVYLPRTGDDVTHEAVAVPALMPRGTERLVLVEDERAVREVAERTLRALGYVVTTAGDGIDALEALDGMRGTADLLLTDVRMPRLGGIELAEQARARWPSLKIVFMSGHSEALVAEAGVAGRVILRKPFSASELAVCIRTALDGGRGGPGGPGGPG